MMKYKFNFVICALFFVSKINSQINLNSVCGTAVPDNNWEQQMSKLVKEYVANNANKGQSTAYTIPVIVHVIHTGQTIGTAPNIAAAQVASQIQVLNHDYGGIGFNNWNYPLKAFVNYAQTTTILPGSVDLIGRIGIANCGIQFCLATKDTLGNLLAEPGIDRINATTKGWTNPATLGTASSLQTLFNGTIKPASRWNVSKYLNIWISDVNINSSGLLGYATFPPLSNLTGFASLTQYLGTSQTDGVWAYAKAFGSSNIYPSGQYYQNYTYGRTATHEIGHWLGMRHIWGDANCATDYADDTPPAKASNFGSFNAVPFHSGTCSGNAPDGEMFMDYMDYPNDDSKYMFTNDQAIRMQTAMQNSPYRKFLGQHNLCSVKELAANAKFATTNSVCQGAALTLSNQSEGTPVPTFTWASNGNPVFNPNNNTAYTVVFPAAGVYTVSLSADNGTFSTITKTITVWAEPSLTLAPNRTNFCIGEEINLDMSGATTYSWFPDSVNTSFVTLPTSTAGILNYTCNVKGAHNCTTTAYVSVKVVDCTNLKEFSQNEQKFFVYPNPSNSFINIESSFFENENLKIEVSDVLGKTYLIQNLKTQKSKVEMSGLNNGIYILKIFNSNALLHSQVLIKE